MQAPTLFVNNYITQHLTNVSVISALPPPPTTSDGAAALLIATHDGKFHVDEALGAGLLRHTARFADAKIVRTRKPDIISGCNCVIDVGGVYDPERNLFDHHQKEFNGTMTTALREYPTRLSSAGLVYKHFGSEIIARYADHCIKQRRLDPSAMGFSSTATAAAASGESGSNSNNSNSNSLTIDQLSQSRAAAVIFDALYKQWVEHIDGGDNGVEQYEGEGIKKNYSVGSTIGSRVGALFPRWNEASSQDLENTRFAEAMTLATLEFYQTLDYLLCAWLPGRAIVEEAFCNRTKEHASGKIMVFRNGVPPWKDHLYDVERENNAVRGVFYVLFDDGKGGWRVMCVSEEDASFTNRKSLLWKGLRDDELNKASGLTDSVFVHVTGFIGGWKSFDSAMTAAVKSLEAAE